MKAALLRILRRIPVRCLRYKESAMNYPKIGMLAVCTVLIGMLACSFMPRKERDALASFEKGIYIVQKDIVINAEAGVLLRKGSSVTLKVATGSDWVKVYGYDAALDPLSAPQVLMLYMFDTDFTNEKFSMSEFTVALNVLVRLKQEQDEKPKVKR